MVNEMNIKAITDSANVFAITKESGISPKHNGFNSSKLSISVNFSKLVIINGVKDILLNAHINKFGINKYVVIKHNIINSKVGIKFDLTMEMLLDIVSNGDISPSKANTCNTKHKNIAVIGAANINGGSINNTETINNKII